MTDDAWRELERALGASRDTSGWLHVTVARRPFSLARAQLGATPLVVAHAAVATHGQLDAAEAAELCADWPIGALVLQHGAWVSRHTFAGAPTATEVTDLLRALAFQLSPLADRLAGRGREHAAALYGHYAD